MSERRPNSPEMREIEAHILWKVQKISDLFPENQQARATYLILKALVGETVIPNGPTSLSLDKLLSQLTSFLTSTARFISIELLERWLHSGSFEAAPELDQVGPLAPHFQLLLLVVDSRTCQK